MKILFTCILLCAIVFKTKGQNNFRAIIKGDEGNALLYGASLTWKEQNKSYTSDSFGAVYISGIGDGVQTFVISYAGYKDAEFKFSFPLKSEKQISIILVRKRIKKM